MVVSICVSSISLDMRGGVVSIRVPSVTSVYVSSVVLVCVPCVKMLSTVIND